MDDRDRYDQGMIVRRAVLGDAHVDRSLTRRTRAVQFWFANGRDRAKRVLTRVEAAYKESTIWRDYVNL
jgi:hypothetical protein